MRNQITSIFLALLMAAGLTACSPAESKEEATPVINNYKLGYDAKTDAALQSKIEGIDSTLRQKYGMTPEQTAVGILDLQTERLAMVNPDRGDYAASVPKIGILLAYFQLNSNAVTHLDPQVKHELGLMAKASNNEMAAKYSRELGLKQIQEVLNSYDLYNTNHGGGIWVGKHYGKGTERYGDPIGDNSHAATVRQLLRYWLWLEQGKLVSPQASKVMMEIFASPDIPHDDIKFVKGLSGRGVSIIRKWGSWENWYHDTADITGPGRHYILVAMTKHPKGDDYLVELSQEVDDLMQGQGGNNVSVKK
jgi:beta-lactamase class A